MSDSPVRVRFAPSPTGYLHVGGVRAMLFNWLYARRHGGKLILRIDDTDQQRSTHESELMVLDTLRALGLNFDEGPDAYGEAAKGDHGPYRQSERFQVYADAAHRLYEEDKAYYCFCSPELITEKRQAALKMGRVPHYDGTCRKISKEEAEKRVAGGEKAGLRMKAIAKNFIVDDLVRGKVEFKEGTVGDFFITRSPSDGENEVRTGIGMPVYNFSCVIDDYQMGMTHVIRGEDHLSNTARQLMIYDALGWKTPVFAHTAMVLGADKQKLSKRNGDVSANDYLAKGYLPEAILNFLVLLGWWPPESLKPISGHPEILSVEEMISVFGAEGMQKSPAVFDMPKLQWMNSFYIKMLPLEEITRRAKPFFEKSEVPAVRDGLAQRDAAWFQELIDIVRKEVQFLSELPTAAAFFFESAPQLEDEAKAALSEGADVAEAFAEGLQNAGSFDEATIKSIQNDVKKKTGKKGKGLFMPMRVVVTGRLHGPELNRIIPVLGKDEVMKRINHIRGQL